jgi:hypothetical protein
MSGGREWAEENRDRWEAEKEATRGVINGILEKYSKKDLELMEYAIRRDVIKNDYEYYKKMAKGKKVPANLKNIGCKESDIRDLLRYRRVNEKKA